MDEQTNPPPPASTVDDDDAKVAARMLRKKEKIQRMKNLKLKRNQSDGRGPEPESRISPSRKRLSDARADLEIPLSTASREQVSELSMLASIRGGAFEDIKFYTFSRRTNDGDVDTPLALFGNSALIRKASTHFDFGALSPYCAGTMLISFPRSVHAGLCGEWDHRPRCAFPKQSRITYHSGGVLLRIRQ